VNRFGQELRKFLAGTEDSEAGRVQDPLESLAGFARAEKGIEQPRMGPSAEICPSSMNLDVTCPLA
jgi:hypothetical protein